MHDADIHAKDFKGEVPLHLAACSLRDSAENDIDEVSPDQCVDLLRTMQLLLEHGADVNARANDGSTPLHYSSFRGIGRGSYGDMGISEGARLLLEHGANIDAENNEGPDATGRSVGVWAAQDGEVSIGAWRQETIE